MTDDVLAELLAADRRLQAAQRTGDLAALDELLDDRLIAIGPEGGEHTKDEDLSAYRDGTSVITSLVEESLHALHSGDAGVTFFLGTVAGTYAGGAFSARLRYTRTWVRDSAGQWRILAAHIAPVS
ncbi:nuclear transport factor 2 family protein [Dactylosporangium sp. CS-033363]|uniref:nuclear transport factor 2 family protein n=1 Tax=Dactylosporangium sp. CS-033363 TaxID=3239935 RepID=UPI003D8DB226